MLSHTHQSNEFQFWMDTPIPHRSNTHLLTATSACPWVVPSPACSAIGNPRNTQSLTSFAVENLSPNQIPAVGFAGFAEAGPI